MQVNCVFGEYARIFENDGPNGRLAAPVSELLVLLAGRTESVERCCPACIGLCPAVEPRESPDRPALFISRFFEPLGTEKFKGTGQSVTERCRLKPSPDARGLKKALTTLDLRLQIFLPVAY